MNATPSTTARTDSVRRGPCAPTAPCRPGPHRRRPSRSKSSSRPAPPARMRAIRVTATTTGAATKAAASGALGPSTGDSVVETRAKRATRVAAQPARTARMRTAPAGPALDSARVAGGGLLLHRDSLLVVAQRSSRRMRSRTASGSGRSAPGHPTVGEEHDPLRVGGRPGSWSPSRPSGRCRGRCGLQQGEQVCAGGQSRARRWVRRPAAPPAW